MRFQGAVIKEQGQTFAVVVVKKSVLDNSLNSNAAIQSFQRFFPGIPIMLMAQDHRGIPSYRGRPDIAKFLSRIPLETIPWREYTVNT